jgi:hypothetical protein
LFKRHFLLFVFFVAARLPKHMPSCTDVVCAWFRCSLPTVLSRGQIVTCSVLIESAMPLPWRCALFFFYRYLAPAADAAWFTILSGYMERFTDFRHHDVAVCWFMWEHMFTHILDAP